MDCCTLVYDQVKLSWLKVVEWCHGSFNPAGSLMTWVDHERIYMMKLALGFEMNPKKLAWETNVKRNLLSLLALGIFYELLVEWDFFLNVQVWTSGLSLFFFLDKYIFFFKNHKRARVSFQNSSLKQISHSLIDIGFIGLVTWSGVRGLMKERIRQAQRVFEGYIE